MAGRKGRFRKPAPLRLITGNASRTAIPEEVHPQVEPAIPAPPEILSDDARKEWRRVSVELYRLGLLTVVDTQTLAAYCTCYARWLEAERALKLAAAADPSKSALVCRDDRRSPFVVVAHQAMQDMVKYAAEFGLTPVARARLAQGPLNPPKSKFSGLVGGTER